MQNFCFENAETVLSKLKTDKNGLSAKEAADRLKTHGPNELQRSKKSSFIKLFFSQFKDFMTVLLIAAAAVSSVIAFISKDKSNLTDTYIILSIIFLNALVGTIQQFRADKAIEKLKKLSSGTAKVKRDGVETVVETSNLTVGDIVHLEEGDMVPADCRILECNNLKCDESALTGEAEGVDKDAAPISGNKVALGNMKNTLFSSTYVISGNAEAVVTGVGMDTEIGKIAAMLKDSKEALTPLEKNLNKLGKIISVFVLAVTAVIFIMGLAVRHEGLLKNFMTSLAIAVAAIPEGLPAVVTIIMAMGVQKMSKKHVVIRKLKSVETLGGCSFICSDKTGTLTQNKMRVTETFFDFKTRSQGDTTGVNTKFLQCIYACTSVKGEKGNYVGDPTEIALKVYADDTDFSQNFETLAQIPFSSERKMMSVAAKFDGAAKCFTKGAPDKLISRCSFILTSSGVRALTAADRAAIEKKNNEMSDGALRVLAFAYGEYSGELREDGLTFIGLAGMSDAVKEGVKEAVEECGAAGIATVMITGDHVRTAFAIAKKLKIARDMREVISGDELDALPKTRRDEVILTKRVFARVTPKHKNMIVSSLKRSGAVVAMTGDGINDAPSIKSADIGIAMGSGTDVTKNVSDMVISDDNFTSIVAAVKEGRRISENVKKTIQFFLSTNLAEVLAILIASFVFFKFDFLLLTQLLWLNLITDSFPVLALGCEKENPDIMRYPPKLCEKALFSKSSLCLVAFFGLFITAVTIGVFAVSLSLWGNAIATTVTFLTISFLELFQSFNVRSEKASLFNKNIFSNKILLVTVAVGVVLNVLLTLTPLSAAFGLTKLNAIQWLTVALCSLSVIPVGEIYRLVYRLLSKKTRFGGIRFCRVGKSKKA